MKSNPNDYKQACWSAQEPQAWERTGRGFATQTTPTPSALRPVLTSALAGALLSAFLPDYAGGSDTASLSRVQHDLDWDSLPDWWEMEHFGSLEQNGTKDGDADRLTDAREYDLGTDPKVQDTDGDGVWDGEEWLGLGSDPALADTDADGLNDLEELESGTDASNEDSDGDGFPDGWENARRNQEQNPLVFTPSFWRELKWYAMNQNEPSLVLVDFGNEGPNANGTPEGWDGLSTMREAGAVDVTDRMGPEIDLRLASEEGSFAADNSGPLGSVGEFDGIDVPQTVSADYFVAGDRQPGTSALLRIDGLPAGIYHITFLGGGASDTAQSGKLWVRGAPEPEAPNTGNFAGGGTTLRIEVLDGESLYYRHLEDGVGGISGLIIRQLWTTLVHDGGSGDSHPGTLLNGAPGSWALSGSRDGSGYLELRQDGQAPMHIATGFSTESLSGPYYTIMAWVRFADTSGDKIIFGQTTLEPALSLGARDGVLYQRNWGTVLVGGEVQTGVWHHVAYVNDLTRSRIIVDGREAVSGPSANAVGLIAELLVGTGGPTSHRSFVGSLDDVRIYSAPLTLRKIRELAGFEPDDQFLQLHYDFEGPTDRDIPNRGRVGFPDGVLNPALSREQVIEAFGQGSPSPDGPGVLIFSGRNGADATFIDTQISASFFPGPYTMMAWVNAAAPSGDQWVFGQSIPAAPTLQFGLQETSYHFGLGVGSLLAGSVEPGVWRHVAWRHTGRSAQIVIDGVTVGDSDHGSLITVINGSSIQIGGSIFGTAFAGMLDDVRIYVGELSDAQIAAFAGIGDSDADGLPDPWERLHFQNLDQNGFDDPDGDGADNASEHAAQTHPLLAGQSSRSLTTLSGESAGRIQAGQHSEADSDGDGMSDADEAVAGTNPIDATDLLRLSLIHSASGSLQLQFHALQGRIYEIEFSPSLEAASWEVVDRITGNGRSHRVAQPAYNPNRLREGYYRLRVRDKE